MAPSTFDIVVLSSSPPDHARASANAAAPQSLSPSSPFNPQRVGMSAQLSLQLSPGASPPRKTIGALKSGSRAASIPEGALRGFATARSLVLDCEDEELQEFDWELAGTTKGDDGHSKDAKRPRKRSEKSVVAGDAAEVPQAKPRARKPKMDRDGNTTKPATARKRAVAPTTSPHFVNPAVNLAATDPVESLDDPPKAKATKPRKPRAKKAPNDDQTQTTIKRTKVIKPRGTTRAAKAAKEKTADVVSGHFRDTRGEDRPEITVDALNGDDAVWDVPLSPSSKKKASSKEGIPKQRPPDDQPLELDEAVNRRRDWTPIKDTEPLHVLTDLVGKENDSTVTSMAKSSFTGLLSGYTYAGLDLASDATMSTTATSEGIGVMKRRRVELVDVPGNRASSRQSSPEKGKAPKKKPRTITDLVTDQYAPRAATADAAAMTSNFFSPHTTTTTSTIRVPLNDTADSTITKVTKKPARKRSTSKSASENDDGKSRLKSKKSSAKTGNAKPKLIAGKLLSPTSALLRLNRQDMLFGTSSQLALDESPIVIRQIQQAMFESEAAAELCEPLGAEHVAVWPRLQRIEGKRNLWAASARDDDGQMLDRQAVYMPAPDRSQDFPLLMDGVNNEDGRSPVQTNNVEPSEPVSAPILISSDLPTPPPTIPGGAAGKHQNGVDEALFLDIDDPPQEPPPSNQHVASSFLYLDDFSPSIRLPPDSPRSPVPSTASTLRSLGSPKRKSGRPSKTQPAIPQQVTASAPIPKKSPAKSKPSSTAPPTTPRKNQDRFADIEEILDSEDDTALSPTPPRFRKLVESPSLQLSTRPPPPLPAKDDLVPIFRIPESHLLFANIKSTLFSRISKLVRSLPPTTNPSKPSWHEKILMYDAIILEDFTAFLNTHSTIRTYRRATQKQVKAWNKDLKAKGEEKMVVAEGDGTVLAMEKKVETWMVRVWCEEMGVCCVVREGRGRGSVRKGLY